MGDIKNLEYQEAADKLKELAENKICLFCTYENNEIVSRPMGTAGVDEDGALWFMSRKDSLKNMQVKKNNHVHLMYLDSGKNHYLSLSGNAVISQDRKKINELWNPLAKAWFEEGKDDPELSLIKVTPDKGHYWDTQNGKLVTMIKIAAAAITGKKNDDGGVEGDIEI